MSKQRNLPIGVYDSGVGGVSVLKELVKLLPQENYFFYGDNANAPYGTRDVEEIKDLSIACGEFLYNKGVKMLVIACNTATSIVVQTLRKRYQIPVISMEPAIKPASEKYSTGKIAVLATPATLKQQKYLQLVEKLQLQDRIVSIGCAGLVELIEAEDLQSANVKKCLREKLAPLKGEDVSAIVIGCTHYSFVIQQIEEVANEMLTGCLEVFDGKKGTANRVAEILRQEDLSTTRTKHGQVSFFTSGNHTSSERLKKFYNL